MQIAILANPYSGRGAGPELARVLATDLTGRGHRADVYVGANREDAVDWAREAAVRAERLVVVGGDGSLSAVVAGLPAAPPPVALLPLGTSNLLGQEWKLPRNPGRVARLVEAGCTRLLDTGLVNGRRAFAVWDFGLGGELMRRMEEMRNGPIRKSQYLPLLPRMLREWTPKPQEVVADGEELGLFDYGIVAGVRSYASRVLHLGPARYDDGLWELYLFPRMRARWGAWLALNALVGRVHRCRGVVHRKVRRVQVRGGPPTPVQIDGDYVGDSPVEFMVSDFQLPLLVPAA